MFSLVRLICVIGAAVALEVPVVNRPYYLTQGLEAGVYSHVKNVPLVDKVHPAPFNFYNSVDTPVFRKQYWPVDRVSYPTPLFPYSYVKPYAQSFYPKYETGYENQLRGGLLSHVPKAYPSLAEQSPLTWYPEEVVYKKVYNWNVPQEDSVSYPTPLFPYSYVKPYAQSFYPKYETGYENQLRGGLFSHVPKVYPSLAEQTPLAWNPEEVVHKKVYNWNVPQVVYDENLETVTPSIGGVYKKYSPLHLFPQTPVVVPQTALDQSEVLSVPYKTATNINTVTPVLPFGQFYSEGVTGLHDLTYKTPLVIKPRLH